jgi:hypothetical protein
MKKPAGIIELELQYSDISDDKTSIPGIFYNNIEEFLQFRGPWELQDFYCGMELGFGTAYDAKQFADSCVKLGYFKRQDKYYTPTDELMEVLHGNHGQITYEQEMLQYEYWDDIIGEPDDLDEEHPSIEDRLSEKDDDIPF